MPTQRPTSKAGGASTGHPLFDQPLGNLQTIILRKIDELGADAYVYKILKDIREEFGIWVDPSQAYSCVRLLADSTNAYIKPDGEPRPSAAGGPPVKIYELTEKGKQALDASTQHALAMLDFLLSARSGRFIRKEKAGLAESLSAPGSRDFDFDVEAELPTFPSGPLSPRLRPVTEADLSKFSSAPGSRDFGPVEEADLPVEKKAG